MPGQPQQCNLCSKRFSMKVNIQPARQIYSKLELVYISRVIHFQGCHCMLHFTCNLSYWVTHNFIIGKCTVPGQNKCQTKWCCLNNATKEVQWGISQSVNDSLILPYRESHWDPRPWRWDATHFQRLRYGQPLTLQCGPTCRYALIRTGCSIRLPTAKQRYRKGALNSVTGENLSTGDICVLYMNRWRAFKTRLLQKKNDKRRYLVR